MTEHTLLTTSDAMVWAEEFCRIFNGFTIVQASAPPSRPGEQAIDEGAMVGWFANAMETAVNLCTVAAQRNEDGTVTLLGDVPARVLIDRELLMRMIEQHNREVLREA
jgi:hypothetical protein